MNIPPTTHLEIKYRNGETGILLTTQRTGMLSVMSVRDKDDSILFHSHDGKYCGVKNDHEYDIVEVG